MSDATGASAQDTVDLRLAVNGTALWPAVEAAQFARIVSYDDPGNDSEKSAIHSFLDTFSQVTEGWEQTRPENRSAYLKILGDHVAALEGLGLFIHWGCVERRLAASGYEGELVPLAIISVDRQRLSRLTVALPEELDVSPE